jgi:hypothetical protein
MSFILNSLFPDRSLCESDDCLQNTPGAADEKAPLVDIAIGEFTSLMLRELI